jgi:hypothetical protein
MDRQIISAICGTIPGAIIHIQIEKDGQVQFGAYGNFYPESIYLGGRSGRKCHSVARLSKYHEAVHRTTAKA